MQYEPIILELMSRIKVLETEVSNMKEQISFLESSYSSTGPAPENSPPQSHQGKTPTAYTRTTDEMIHACYTQGKSAYQTPGSNIWSLADQVSEETGMNRNSAFMYICAVRNMLGGNVFKRAVNVKALNYYLEAIHRDYGADGLRAALSSVQQNIAYRQRYNLPSDSFSALYDTYKEKLNP